LIEKVACKLFADMRENKASFLVKFQSAKILANIFLNRTPCSIVKLAGGD